MAQGAAPALTQDMVGLLNELTTKIERRLALSNQKGFYGRIEALIEIQDGRGLATEVTFTERHTYVTRRSA